VAKSIRRREVITRAAVGATFLIAWPVASQPQQVIYSGGEIVPGERIGPLQLRGKIDEVKQLFGPGILAIDGGPRRPQLFSLQAWNAIGLSVQFDSMTGNIVWISVEVGPASEAWAEYITPEGIRLRSRGEDVVARMGTPERTLTTGRFSSLYYDRRGIRFTLLDLRPRVGVVAGIRIVWPSIPRGDTLIVPGERISGIEVGAPIDAVLAVLEGGYHKGESSPGLYVCYWPHLGLGLTEKAGRVTSVRAVRQSPSDAFGIRYSIADGLGQESTATQVKQAFGEPEEISTNPSLGEYWYYRSRGIAVAFNSGQTVRLVDVFPPEEVHQPVDR
jgi:hypothetical protein